MKNWETLLLKPFLITFCQQISMNLKKNRTIMHIQLAYYIILSVEVNNNALAS